MFLLRELGFFFVTRTDASKTQVPSFCQKKGPKSPKYFQLGSFFSCLRLNKKIPRKKIRVKCSVDVPSKLVRMVRSVLVAHMKM
jgi:hypothetical protein